MSKEDIIRMAREAGLPFGQRGAIPLWDKELARFAALVRAAEREACAKVCDEFESEADPDAGFVLASAIRARSKV